MSIARDRFRQLLESDVCTLAAPIFDSLSARIAHLEGWPVCKLNGSAAKAAHLGLPDDVALANMTDLAEICRAICRDPDISLIVDADDVGGGILNVKRGIEDLEAAGVCAIEVDDTSIPPTFRERDRRDARLYPIDVQVERLRSAVSARRDPATVIAARTHIFGTLPIDEASERIAAYASAGIQAVMLADVSSREQICAAHAAAGLPMIIFDLTPDVVADTAFLKENGIRIRYGDQIPYHLAVRGIQSGLRRLQSGDKLTDLADQALSASLMAEIAGVPELRRWEDGLAGV